MEVRRDILCACTVAGQERKEIRGVQGNNLVLMRGKKDLDGGVLYWTVRNRSWMLVRIMGRNEKAIHGGNDGKRKLELRPGWPGIVLSSVGGKEGVSTSAVGETVLDLHASLLRIKTSAKIANKIHQCAGCKDIGK